MASAKNRPLSPHLQIWKWGPHMTVSILHRVSGFILASVAMLTLVWFLMAVSGGEESYFTFLYYVVEAVPGDTFGFVANIFFRLLGVAVSWAFFQHLFSGLRHLVLDMGAGYELTSNRTWSIAVMMGAMLCTLALWASAFLGLL